MLSLIYVSRMMMRSDEQAVAELARRAEIANSRLGITGLLLWNSLHFMQLLEGEGQQVMDVMTRIANDPRHTDIVYLRTEERATRECPDWGMQAQLSPLTGAGALSGFADALPATLATDTRILFTSFASALRPAMA